ncbi:MAG: hypothetical protein ACLP01_22255 [Solirubrobacteraceae bacterium]
MFDQARGVVGPEAKVADPLMRSSLAMQIVANYLSTLRAGKAASIRTSRSGKLTLGRLFWRPRPV